MSVSPYICSPINIADTQVHLEVLKLGRGFVHVVLAASHQQQTAGNYISEQPSMVMLSLPTSICFYLRAKMVQ